MGGLGGQLGLQNSGLLQQQLLQNGGGSGGAAILQVRCLIPCALC
jgi:hypothetical protein